MTKFDASRPVESVMVSIRLPGPVAKRLDLLAENAESSRTDIIRRALATYFRLGDSILVPISRATRNRLEELAEEKDCSTEILTEQMLEEAINEHSGRLNTLRLRMKYVQEMNYSVSRSSHEGFKFSTSRLEDKEQHVH